MALAEQTTPVKFLIGYRDPKFTGSFAAVFAAEGIRNIKTPVRRHRRGRQSRSEF